jgi:membrane-bound ClpP family serine protease
VRTLAALLLTTSLARADVSLHDIEIDGRTVTTVRVTDFIGIDELSQIGTALKRARASDRKVFAIEMNSPGGDAIAGMQIAEFVSGAGWRVYMSGDCWSACSPAAMVALGRGRLLIAPQARLGVHQAHDDNDTPYVGWTDRSAARLVRMGAPRRIVDSMRTTAPGDMTSFPARTLARMGGRRVNWGWSW